MTLKKDKNLYAVNIYSYFIYYKQSTDFHLDIMPCNIGIILFFMIFQLLSNRFFYQYGPAAAAEKNGKFILYM